MIDLKKNNFLFSKVSELKGVGKKISLYLKNKNIENINDLLWNFPYSQTDRTNQVKINKLMIGKILTVKVKPIKYNFPRIRNLPNKIICEDDTGKIEITYFNSREGYLRKIFPLNKWIIVSGKINFYKKKYQMTNPDYVTEDNNIDYVKKIIPKYSLTEGINEKMYRKIISQVIAQLPDLDEWHDQNTIDKFKFHSWKESVMKLHLNFDPNDYNSIYYKRLAFDEIISHLLIISENRKKIRKINKVAKLFQNENSQKLINNLPFDLTADQKKVIKEIEIDLKSSKRMFRILQGDVGSGKTIVALNSCVQVIAAGYQCAFMAPTEILAKQHFKLSEQLLTPLNIKVEFLSGKTSYLDRKKILKNLSDGKIDLLIGTHALFQKKIEFKKLGFIIVDEQHKFGVKQRIKLAKKGGDNCDVLLMSATPIPRTMMLVIYGDMDVSKITEKPSIRKPIITLSKPESKIDELWPFVKKQIRLKNQIFWVCPLIDVSRFLDYSSVLKKFSSINKIFPDRVGLIHGALDKEEKNDVLKKFQEKKIDILVSTTVIEVGVDFPDANLIIIENANKFGLAQLHQLRGRVGRGSVQGTCILLYKGSLNKNAIKRIKILKSSDDGFHIADEDMRLRGFGDILGFQQSGIKYFKIADPVLHEDLFKYSEKYLDILETGTANFDAYETLLKLFDKAEVLNIDQFN